MEFWFEKRHERGHSGWKFLAIVVSSECRGYINGRSSAFSPKAVLYSKITQSEYLQLQLPS